MVEQEDLLQCIVCKERSTSKAMLLLCSHSVCDSCVPSECDSINCDKCDISTPCASLQVHPIYALNHFTGSSLTCCSSDVKVPSGFRCLSCPKLLGEDESDGLLCIACHQAHKITSAKSHELKKVDKENAVETGVFIGFCSQHSEKKAVSFCLGEKGDGVFTMCKSWNCSRCQLEHNKRGHKSIFVEEKHKEVEKAIGSALKTFTKDSNEAKESLVEVSQFDQQLSAKQEEIVKTFDLIRDTVSKVESKIREKAKEPIPLSKNIENQISSFKHYHEQASQAGGVLLSLAGVKAPFASLTVSEYTDKLAASQKVLEEKRNRIQHSLQQHQTIVLGYSEAFKRNLDTGFQRLLQMLAQLEGSSEKNNTPPPLKRPRTLLDTTISGESLQSPIQPERMGTEPISPESHSSSPKLVIAQDFSENSQSQEMLLNNQKVSPEPPDRFSRSDGNNSVVHHESSLSGFRADNATPTMDTSAFSPISESSIYSIGEDFSRSHCGAEILNSSFASKEQDSSFFRKEEAIGESIAKETNQTKENSQSVDDVEEGAKRTEKNVLEERSFSTREGSKSPSGIEIERSPPTQDAESGVQSVFPEQNDTTEPPITEDPLVSPAAATEAFEAKEANVEKAGLEEASGNIEHSSSVSKGNEGICPSFSSPSPICPRPSKRSVRFDSDIFDDEISESSQELIQSSLEETATGSSPKSKNNAETPLQAAPPMEAQVSEDESVTKEQRIQETSVVTPKRKGTTSDEEPQNDVPNGSEEEPPIVKRPKTANQPEDEINEESVRALIANQWMSLNDIAKHLGKQLDIKLKVQLNKLISGSLGAGHRCENGAIQFSLLQKKVISNPTTPRSGNKSKDKKIIIKPSMMEKARKALLPEKKDRKLSELRIIDRAKAFAWALFQECCTADMYSQIKIKKTSSAKQYGSVTDLLKGQPQLVLSVVNACLAEAFVSESLKEPDDVKLKIVQALLPYLEEKRGQMRLATTLS